MWALELIRAAYNLYFCPLPAVWLALHEFFIPSEPLFLYLWNGNNNTALGGTFIRTSENIHEMS